MPFEIMRQDITKLSVDAIVNAANTHLQQGGGVCGAIFAAAGAAKLQAACDAIGHCDVGHSVITPGFALPARYVIHTVGPVWQGGGHQEEVLLKSCYRTALQLAVDHQLESIAFPLISSGIYGYPKDQALRVATQAIREFLATPEQDLSVYLVVFDRQAVVLSEALQGRIARYIDDQTVELHERRRDISNRPDRNEYPIPDLADRDIITLSSYELGAPLSSTLDDHLNHLDETFNQRLLRLIDEKGLTDVVVYKRANLDRKLFSKIRSDVHYQPKKATALALGIALELSIEEMRDLLETAGYALSKSNRMDLIIAFFIDESRFDIDEINETLFAYELPVLGAS